MIGLSGSCGRKRTGNGTGARGAAVGGGIRRAEEAGLGNDMQIDGRERAVVGEDDVAEKTLTPESKCSSLFGSR